MRMLTEPRGDPGTLARSQVIEVRGVEGALHEDYRSTTSHPLPLIGMIDLRSIRRDVLAPPRRRIVSKMSVITYSSFEEAEKADPSLLLVWLAAARAREFVSTLEKRRRECARPHPPIIAILDAADADLIRRANDLGLSLISEGAATSPILAASIRLALAGACFASPELLYAVRDKTGDCAAEDLTASSLLSPREQQILNLLSRGLLNKTIAYELGISTCTVKAHVQKIMKKLKATNRTQAAFLARARAL